MDEKKKGIQSIKYYIKITIDHTQVKIVQAYLDYHFVADLSLCFKVFRKA